MQSLEEFEHEQALIVETFEKLQQGLRISTGLRKRKAELLSKPWDERSDLHRYDELTARESKFLTLADRGLGHAHRELRALHRNIEEIHVPSGSRSVEHKELVHAKQDLLDMYGIIDEVYRDWGSLLHRARARLRKQLTISASEDLEETRTQLRRLELAELEWERTLTSRIERFHDVEEKVNRLSATRFLKWAIPSTFTLGSALSVHSIQRGNFAPEDNISGIVGVFCVMTAAIMYLILLHEHKREIEIVEEYLEGH